MQGVHAVLAPSSPMLHAQGYVTIGSMAELKRGQDEIARQNLVYVIEACSKRLGGPRGGVRHLAQLLGTQETYISQLASGYRGRTPGKKLKARIETKFGLDPDWMDHAHDGSVVEWLVPRVPSLPYSQSRGTPAARSGLSAHQRSVNADLQRQIDELRSLLASKQSTRK